MWISFTIMFGILINLPIEESWKSIYDSPYCDDFNIVVEKYYYGDMYLHRDNVEFDVNIYVVEVETGDKQLMYTDKMYDPDLNSDIEVEWVEDKVEITLLKSENSRNTTHNIVDGEMVHEYAEDITYEIDFSGCK